LGAIYDGNVTVVEVEPEDVARAIDLIGKYVDYPLTLTDATSMAVMLRLQIGRVFSFDSDFLVVGFVRVPPLE
jgi:predicted nucleic acid-binding protein